MSNEVKTRTINQEKCFSEELLQERPQEFTQRTFNEVTNFANFTCFTQGRTKELYSSNVSEAFQIKEVIHYILGMNNMGMIYRHYFKQS